MTPVKDKLDKVIQQLGTVSERLRYNTEIQERVLATEKRKTDKFDELLTRTDWNVPQTMHRLDSIERSQKKNEHDIEMIKKGQARIEEKLENLYKLVQKNENK